jgi:hypothetical protein
MFRGGKMNKEQLAEANRMLEECLANPNIGHNTNTVKEVKKGDGLSFFMKRKLYNNPKVSHIATMFYDNQTVKHFIIMGSAPYFMENNKGYIIYSPASFFDLNQTQSHLFYAEGNIMPIDSIKIMGGEKVSFAIHPDNFREIWESQELKIVLTAKSLKKWLFYIILITGITLFVMVIMLLITGGPIIAEVFNKARGTVAPGG